MNLYVLWEAMSSGMLVDGEKSDLDKKKKDNIRLLGLKGHFLFRK